MHGALSAPDASLSIIYSNSVCCLNLAQPDSENDTGAFPAEERNMQSEIDIAHKTQKAPPATKKIL